MSPHHTLADWRAAIGEATTTFWRCSLGGSCSIPVHSPAYLAIVDGIAADIGTGRLLPGERLPPQRRLAARLRADDHLYSLLSPWYRL